MLYGKCSKTLTRKIIKVRPNCHPLQNQLFPKRILYVHILEHLGYVNCESLSMNLGHKFTNCLFTVLVLKSPNTVCTEIALTRLLCVFTVHLWHVAFTGPQFNERCSPVSKIVSVKCFQSADLSLNFILSDGKFIDIFPRKSVSTFPANCVFQRQFCMKCQTVFSRKTYFKMSSTEIYLSMLTSILSNIT